MIATLAGLVGVSQGGAADVPPLTLHTALTVWRFAPVVSACLIWVAAGSQLFRFDLATGKRHPIAIPAGASAGGLALDETDGVVWVENCGCPDR